MLRDVLGRYLRIPATEVELDADARGKPRLAVRHGEALRFNLSHSGDAVLLGIAYACEIGVDVEATLAHDDLAGVAANVFTADELDAFTGLYGHERIELFYSLWTRKEACLKAWGTGLGVPPNAFGVLPASTGSAALESPVRCNLPDLGSSLACRSIRDIDGHAAAVAVAGSCDALSCWHWPGPSERT